ncbi:MAG TPA: hypothetical protein VN428_25325 [Bryobacteraceae bacterium]|nr:hypothetical protein [Bryobacteraceae bacterium]
MTKYVLLAVLGAALLPAAQRPGPAARFDSWKIIGPGGAGGMFLPTISPHDPNIVIESCDMTGTYISVNGGESWRMFNLRGVTSAVAFDPNRPGVIYVGGAVLWRSQDNGKSWSMIFPDPGKDTVDRMLDDHAGPAITTGDPVFPQDHYVQSILVDPGDSSRLYVAFTGRLPVDSRHAAKDGTVLFASSDFGKSWSRLKEFPGEMVHLMYSVSGSRDLNVVADSGVYRLASGRWQHLAAPSAAKIQSASAGTQGDIAYLYATTGEPGGLYVSRDGGRTWVKSVVAGPESGNLSFQSVGSSSRNAATAYVGFDGLELAGERYYGVAKTRDGGRTWTISYQESSEPAGNVQHSWVADFYGGAGPIRDIFVAPTNPDIVHVTDSCPRALRTTDGGRAWQEVVAAHRGKDRWGRDKWTTTGFDVTTCYGIHFDPFNPKNQFISYTDVGLWKSIDGGASWMSSITGIRHHWDNTTYWVEFDPKVRGLMWGAFSKTHDLPRPKMWRRAGPDSFQGGIASSTDGGDHWIVAEGLPETAVTHIILDPNSPVGSRTLYATAFGKGVYKSTDNGKTWALKNNGIDSKQPFAWRLVRADGGTLYLIVSRRSEEAGAGPEYDGALYKSTDGAERWVKMPLPQGVNGPTGLAIDPTDSKRMYLSAWGIAYPAAVAGGGVFLSRDGGETWKSVFGASQHVYDVTLDPRNPKILYNSGFESGAYRSADGGETWNRIKGFNFKWGHRVIPDPIDPGRIYITTFGGSVWHGPAEGDPTAIEDIVTPIKVDRPSR